MVSIAQVASSSRHVQSLENQNASSRQKGEKEHQEKKGEESSVEKKETNHPSGLSLGPVIRALSAWEDGLRNSTEGPWNPKSNIVSVTGQRSTGQIKREQRVTHSGAFESSKFETNATECA